MSWKIALDIDGVVRAFFKGVNAYALAHHPDIFPGKDENYGWDCYTPDWFKVIWPEIEHDQLFWAGLGVSDTPPFAPAAYITHQNTSALWHEDWIKRNMGNLTAPVVVVEHGKSKVDALLDYEIDLFVDDRYETFLEVNRAGIPCLLYDASYNLTGASEGLRIHSLAEITRFI